MSRITRARRIRDIILAEGRLSFEASLALGDRARLVSNSHWRASIAKARLGYTTTPEVEAIKLDLWVEGEKVAVIAWTEEEFWVPRIIRGSWEADHFNQPPYRRSHERWIEICNQVPKDPSVIALMSMTKVGTDARPQARRTRRPAPAIEPAVANA